MNFILFFGFLIAGIPFLIKGIYPPELLKPFAIGGFFLMVAGVSFDLMRKSKECHVIYPKILALGLGLVSISLLSQFLVVIPKVQVFSFYLGLVLIFGAIFYSFFEWYT